MGKVEIYKLIKNYFADKPVAKVSVFGSFARGDDDKGSDIDILIEMERPVGLFALGRYIVDLEGLTNKKIDLATTGSLRPEFFKEINKDMKLIYEK